MKSNSIASLKVKKVAVDLIDESPLNPRKHFTKLPELAESLRVGQIEPLLVRSHPTEAGRYELANGARRLRAARLGGIESLAVRVAPLTDAEMFDIILGTGAVGNVDSLTPFEEAEGYAAAMAKLQLTLEGCAKKFGRSVTHVQQRRSLLAVPAELRRAVEEQQAGASIAAMVARIPGAENQKRAVAAILHPVETMGPLSTRAAAQWIEAHTMTSLSLAEFDRKAADVVPGVPACEVCPLRSGNNLDLAAEGVKLAGKAQQMCMQPECFAKKQAAGRAAKIAKEQAAGHLVLSEEENAAVFPADQEGIYWASDYVELNCQPAFDMIKPEVASVPTWKKLVEGEAATVQVHVGFDQNGRTVDLVKRAEALAAVVANEEHAIFRPEVIKQVGVPAAKVAKGAKGEKEGSIVAGEKQRTAEDRASAKATLAREIAAAKWLTELQAVLEKPYPIRQTAMVESYVFWALLFDLQLEALTDADLEFLKSVGIAWYEPEEGAIREQFKVFAGGFQARELAALVAIMQLTPRVRAEGTESALVREWHDQLMGAERDAAADAAALADEEALNEGPR
jgi:ParB/RepB/Spo0J family partition protein